MMKFLLVLTVSVAALCGSVFAESGSDNVYPCPHSGVTRLAHSWSCSKFVQCVNGVAVEKDCAHGLFFDAENQWCTEPSRTNCTIESSLCPSWTDPEDLVYLSNGHDCSKYFMCYDGEPLPFQCASGLTFNTYTNQCDNDGGWCPTANVTCGGNGTTEFIPDYDNCAAFIQCQDGVAYGRQCHNGYLFDSQTSRCVETGLADCAVPTFPTTMTTPTWSTTENATVTTPTSTHKPTTTTTKKPTTTTTKKPTTTTTKKPTTTTTKKPTTTTQKETTYKTTTQKPTTTTQKETTYHTHRPTTTTTEKETTYKTTTPKTTTQKETTAHTHRPTTTTTQKETTYKTTTQKTTTEKETTAHTHRPTYTTTQKTTTETETTAHTHRPTTTTTTTTTTTPAPQLNLDDYCKVREVGYVAVVAHPERCDWFINCVNGHGAVGKCGNNQVFYEKRHRCVLGNPETCKIYHDEVEYDMEE